MSTDLSTLLLLSGRNCTQTLLTRPMWECQLISTYTNSAHQAQAVQLTLNQQVPGSSPGRRTREVLIKRLGRSPACSWTSRQGPPWQEVRRSARDRRLIWNRPGRGSSERCSSTSRAGQHETAALETRLPEPRRLRSTQLQRRPSSDIIK